MPKAGAKPAATADDAQEDEQEAQVFSGPEEWFQSLDDTEDYTKAVFYGKEGTGKTTSAAHAANKGRTLVVNAEGGLKKTALARQGVDTSQLAVWPPAGVDLNAQTLEALHSKLLHDLRNDPDSWYCLVFDSLTEIHHVLREQATDTRVQKSRVALDPDFVDRDDYGKMTNQLRKLIRRFRDLPCHVVFLCLEKDDDEAKQFRPSLTPALVTDVLGYVDLVGRFGSPDDTFRARFKGTDRIRAKDRFGILPDSLADPSFTRVQAWLTGELDAETDLVQQEQDKDDAEKAAARAAEEAEKAAAKAAAKKRAPRKVAPKKAEETPSSDEPLEEPEPAREA